MLARFDLGNLMDKTIDMWLSAECKKKHFLLRVFQRWGKLPQKVADVKT